MGIERHFLGWDGPMLAKAARWLADRFGRGRMLDLSTVTVATPGRRASRRLLERLVEAAERDGATLSPPRLATLGSLPDLLCDSELPVAGELEAGLARVRALREAPPDAIATLTPRRPESEDLLAWWELAEQLRSLSDELASAGLRIAETPGRAEQVGFDLRHLDRFAALAEIEAAQHRHLAARGRMDRQAARLQCVEARRRRCDGPIVLVAAADLSPLLTRMLHLVGESQSVVALVHADADEAAGFDELGGLRTGYWRDRAVALPDDRLHFVDRPTDQAREVVRVIAERAGADGGGEPTLTADAVTVGVGDETLAGPLLRAMEMADIPARYGPGRPVLKSRPQTLLEALGRFAGDRRLDDFAELLRHPDIEAYVTRTTAASRRTAGSGAASATHAWLTLLDTYATEHLQERFDGDWLGDEHQQAALRALWEAVAALLPPRESQPRPLGEWSGPILDALRRVYGHETLSRHEADDAALAEALGAVADVLREHARVDAEALDVPAVTLSQAISLALRRLDGVRLPETDGGPAVELVGYLELQLDEAPHLILTAMNEGAVPGVTGVDPLLPDALRARLGLADRERRYARDLMMLVAIVNSRPDVTLIAGRRSAQGDPLAPSRLLLACDDEALVRRIERFYGIGDEPPAAPPMLLTPGERDRFLIPPPLMDEPVLESLSVTAFRDYIACPYRFYLKHVLHLRGFDDSPVEMDAMIFGSLAHDVMERFGESDCAESTRADEIAAFLCEHLDQCAAARFGAADRPAVRVQVEQLRERLRAFAPHQAELANQGWRIVRGRVEERLEARIDVDGEPFTIVGRVDRIDHHPELGYRILDYKTSSKGQKPDKTHRAKRDGQKTWVDLQLPLYRDLCAPIGVTGRVEVGYLNLPRKLVQTGISVAEWAEDDYDDAAVRRDEIIRALRRQVYWPPSAPPTYADDFTGLCADLSLNRQALIDASEGVSR